MATIEMGLRPGPLRVIFTRGTDFHDQVKADADFDGVAPLLVFGSLAFKAVLTDFGVTADFLITAADIEDLSSFEDRTVTLEHLGATLAKGRFEVT